MRLHFPFFFTRACQNWQQKWSWSWSSLEEALAPKNVRIVNPYKEALNLIIAFINNLWKQLWSVNLDISRSFAPQNGFGFGPTIVGGKYGRSKDAAPVFFVRLRLKLLSNADTWWLCWLETVWLIYLWMSALALINCRSDRRRSKAAASVSFIYLRLGELSYEHSWFLSWLEMMWLKCIWMSGWTL